jgi:hypothetical protein
MTNEEKNTLNEIAKIISEITDDNSAKERVTIIEDLLKFDRQAVILGFFDKLRLLVKVKRPIFHILETMTSMPRERDMTYLEEKKILRNYVRGFYDIQQSRISIGNRICANVFVKIGVKPGNKTKRAPSDTPIGKLLLEICQIEYKRLADAISSGDISLKMMFRQDSVGIISTESEYILMKDYMTLIDQEKELKKTVARELEKFPIWEWLQEIPGVGPLTAGPILGEVDIVKADTVAKFWAYWGGDVLKVPMRDDDGKKILDEDKNPIMIMEARGRKKDHLVEREYIDKDGKLKKKMGISHNPFLRTRLLGVFGPHIPMVHGKKPNKYGFIYHDYKQRKHNLRQYNIEQLVKKPGYDLKKATKEIKKTHPDIRLHKQAIRYAVKMFTMDLWLKWREMEGLPITEPYHIAKLGMSHHENSQTKAA